MRLHIDTKIEQNSYVEKFVQLFSIQKITPLKEVHSPEPKYSIKQDDDNKLCLSHTITQQKMLSAYQSLFTFINLLRRH
jgi:hypothetical protein